MKAGKIAKIISLCMLCVCVMTACGGDKEKASENKPADSSEQQESAGDDGEGTTEEPFVFVYNGTSIAVDADMEALKKELGEPDSYFEQPSCAAQGIAKIYTYPGFEIETYPNGEKDLIACIVLKDDSVATPEGIDLSMTKEKIIAAYGSDYKESGTALVYERGGMKLLFIMGGSGITSIEYDSSVLN